MPDHFSISDWPGPLLRGDGLSYGDRLVGNPNCAWEQNLLFQLARTGTAGFVNVSGSLLSNGW